MGSSPTSPTIKKISEGSEVFCLLYFSGMNTQQKLLLGVAGGVVVLLLLIGGGMWLASRSGGGTVEAEVEGTYEVTYRDQDAVIPAAISDRITSVEKDRLVFERGTRGLDALPKNTPLLFEGQAVRRIESITEEGGNVIVNTAPAKLNEIIQDGTIAWNQEISFGRMATEDRLKDLRFYFGGTALAQTGAAADRVEFEGEINGWKVEVSIRPNSAQSRLDIRIEATKEGAARGSIVAEGWVSDFTAQGNIDYAGGELEEFAYEERGLSGELEIKFAAVALGADVSLFNIPAEIGIPFRVGVVPMEIKLKANLRVVPEVRGTASSQASFKVTYNASRGFRFQDGRVEPLGTLDDQNVAITDETVSAGFIATGMGVGVEFPRLELAVFHETVVPYLALDNYAFTVYTPDPPCQEGGLRQRAVAGLTLSFLGAEYSRERELWKREEITELEGSHCGPRN